jgi:hypothetical protein
MFASKLLENEEISLKLKLKIRKNKWRMRKNYKLYKKSAIILILKDKKIIQLANLKVKQWLKSFKQVILRDVLKLRRIKFTTFEQKSQSNCVRSWAEWKSIIKLLIKCSLR